MCARDKSNFLVYLGGMNILARFTGMRIWFIRFACLQLFLSLLSLPILLAWGLPISVLSPLGNLLFGPVITLFLFISSLIFFAELLHIPNTLPILCLEKLTSYWLWFMHADNATWLVGFAKPSYIIMLVIPLATVIIMHMTLRKPLVTSLSCLCILMCFIGIYLKSRTHELASCTHIPCNKGSLTVLANKEQLVLVDPGFLGQRTSATSWAQYTLMPTLIQTMGKTTVDHLIILQPGTMTFQAIERLLLIMNIKHIYITLWQGDMSPSGLRSFYSLKALAARKAITMTRIGMIPVTIPLNNNETITLTPLPETITTATISYPAIACRALIDNQEITLYSAKCVKKESLE